MWVTWNQSFGVRLSPADAFNVHEQEEGRKRAECVTSGSFYKCEKYVKSSLIKCKKLLSVLQKSVKGEERYDNRHQIQREKSVSYEDHPESKEGLRLQPRTCFVANRSLVSGIQGGVENFFMQLYVRSCHVINADIAVAMAVPITNPTDCELQDVIRFLQADEILGYLAEEARSRVELFCCTIMHVRILPGQTQPAAWAIQLGNLRAFSVQSGPGTVGPFPASINEGTPCW